jgi:hypothetical protein
MKQETAFPQKGAHQKKQKKQNVPFPLPLNTSIMFIITVCGLGKECKWSHCSNDALDEQRRQAGANDEWYR